MIIVTGTLAYDYIMNFPGAFGEHIDVKKIHQINLSFITEEFSRRRGGTAGNVAYTLALLKRKYILLAAAGSDFAEYKRDFKNLGIDTKHVLIDKANLTASGFAMTDKTDNQIWGYFYGATRKSKDLDLSRAAKKGDLVLVGPMGSRGSLSLVRQSISLGLDYMLDPGFILTEVNDRDLGYAVKHAKYLVGNDYEIGLIKKRLKVDGFINKVVITTLAGKGAFIETDEGKIVIKTAKPRKVVDPTGAGDAWRAGFLAALVKNNPLEICGHAGSVAASYAVEEYGTQSHWFTKREFKERLRRILKKI